MNLMLLDHVLERWSLAAVLVVAPGTTTFAAAPPQAESDEQKLVRAQELFTDGERKKARGDIIGAIGAWREAYDILPLTLANRPIRAQLQLDLAKAYVEAAEVEPYKKEKHLRAAKQLFSDHLDDLDTNDPNRPEIEAALGEVEEALASVPVEKPVEPLPEPPVEPEKKQEVDDNQRNTSSPVFEPKVPRWVKIVGMAVGAGLAITGGVLLSYDGKCKDGSKATADNVADCPNVWSSVPAGAGLLAGGGALLLGTTVWLAVDEARVGRSRGVNAMVAWTIRF